MDPKDIQIITALQKQGRLTNIELAEQVNLSPSPCLRRVKMLEQNGTIKGYTALIDQKLYGLPLTILIHIKLERHNQESVDLFESNIKTIPEIMDCYIMTGETDYLLRVLCTDLDSYEIFVRKKLHKVPGIASIDTSFAYGIVKQSVVYPNL